MPATRSSLPPPMLTTRWRPATEDPAAVAEAHPTAETLLSRKWKAEDAPLRASVATAADRPAAAWGPLSRSAATLTTAQWAGTSRTQPPNLADALPEETGRDPRHSLSPSRPRPSRK